MSDVRTISISPEGLIPDLRVIGVHGDLDMRRTPARREPVYATTDDRLARPRTPLRSGSRGKIEIVVDSKPLAGNDIPGNGTRFRPLPAHTDRMLLAIGERETVALAKIRRVLAERPPTATLAAFMAWLGERDDQDEVPARAVGTNVVWYAKVPDALALWAAIEHVAADSLRSAINGPIEDVEELSWWLSR